MGVKIGGETSQAPFADSRSTQCDQNTMLGAIKTLCAQCGRPGTLAQFPAAAPLID